MNKAQYAPLSKMRAIMTAKGLRLKGSNNWMDENEKELSGAKLVTGDKEILARKEI